MKIVELEIKDLVVPQGLLPRVLTGTVEEKVEEYAEMIEQGVEFDPILVWEREDGSYWVIDGVHRVEAHKKAGKERIKVKLVKCKDELDYRIKAIQANLKHGLALTKGERAILAQTLYKQGLSEEEIRKVFGVSGRTVREWLKTVKEEEKQAKVKRVLELRERGWKIKDIARELGVPRRTIANWLAKTELISKIAKLELITPTGSPTPEGLRLWSEYVEQADTKTDAFSDSGFYTFLKNKGYEVEYHGQFIATVREEVDKYIKNAVENGLTETEIRTLLSKAKRGIFEHISSTAKAKLAGLLSDYIKKLIEQREERQKEENLILETAKEILQNPEFVFSNWTNLGKLILEEQRLSHKYHEGMISEILQKYSNTLLDIYNSIPEVSEEELKEIAKGFDLDEFEDLNQFRETLKAQVIQEGKRPAGADTFATSLWNEYQSQKLKEESLNESLEEVEDEEEYIRRRVEEQLPDFEKTWERIFGNQEKQEEKKEEKPKLKRGRPPRQEEPLPKSPAEQYLRVVQEIQYYTLWILDKFGREDAIRTLENLINDLKTLSNKELWQAWKIAYGRAVADGRIRSWRYWDK